MSFPALAVHWVHDLSPFLVRFSENFGVRWYGLAYVAGFLVAYLLLRWLIRLGCSELREEQAADFITFAALFGVMLGGRLGYMMFYNFEEFIRQPWIFFYFLEGGMSSHGGFLGLVAFTWAYARVHKISFAGLGDNLVTVATPGIFLGRAANFINGELYGRETESRLGVIFPRSAGELPWPDLQALLARFHAESVEHLVELSRGSEAIQAELALALPARHPSQLYEGLAEGLLLFAVLLAVRLRWRNLAHGILSGLFFILYALGRIAVETLREPDSAAILGMTRGQFYSLFMIAVGAAFLAWAWRAKRRARPPVPAK